MDEEWPMWKKSIVVFVLVAGVAYMTWPYLKHLKQALTPLPPQAVPPKTPPKSPSPEPLPAKRDVVPLSSEAGFCYVGTWQGVRSCVEVSGGCESNQVFPTHELCQNPRLRP